jgi:PA14 domain/Divergent InlB B-repeat domain/Carbohydrate binding module (family 35)
VKPSVPAPPPARLVFSFPRIAPFHIAFPFLALASAGFAAVSDLRVEQALTVSGTTYSVTPALKISFNLSQSSPVTVKISRHLARYEQFKWPYVAKPILLRELNQGTMGAGAQTITWDGLDQNGQMVVEEQNTSTKELAAMNLWTTATLEQLTQRPPVNLFQISVEAGGEKVFTNFERAVGMVRPNRTVRPFKMGVVDRDGSFLVSDFWHGCVWRYSPDWAILGKYPRDHTRGQGFEPDECEAAGADSLGNVFAMSASGIFRFNSSGDPAPWPVQSDYTKYKPFGHVLGRTGPNTDERFGGFAVDDQDNIYLGQTQPNRRILVFNRDGLKLREISLPDGRRPGSICWMGNNTIALTAIGSNPEGVLLYLDATTGAVKRQVGNASAPLNNPLKCWAGPDRTIYAGHSEGDVRRYDANGDPVPFNAALPTVPDNLTHEIRFYGHEVGLPANAPGYPQPAGGYMIPGNSGFAVSSSINGNDPLVETDLSRFAKDGTYLPEKATFSLGRHASGNVFLDNEPASFVVFATNFQSTNQTFTAAWTLTDFDGLVTTGSSTFTTVPNARQTVPLTVNAPALGHYRLKVDILQNGVRLEQLEAQMARIASRDTGEKRYSPFAMCLTGEFELMKLAGIKSHRGDSASWGNTVEPLPGVFYPDRPDVVQFPRGGAEPLRAYGRREGLLLLNGLNYGENWLGGDWVGQPRHFLYSYERYYDYCLRILDRFSGKGEAFYQFWNEPNNFWRPLKYTNTPFGREHFTLVQQHVWSIVKARDKNALAIADGEVNDTRIMDEFATYDAANCNDTVQMHYPGAFDVAWSDIRTPDLPEIRAFVVTKLVQTRDKSFPGKEVWNTEDSVPANPKTPEVAAANLPRIFIPQIAVGVDKIYMFPQTGINSMRRDVSSCLDENGHPFPTYVSLAAMTKLIEGAVLVGTKQYDAEAYGYLFARGQDFVLAANTFSGTRSVPVDAGGTIVDLMGRTKGTTGASLTISPQMQYLLLPRTSPGALAIAQAELQRQLNALGLPNAGAIPAEVTRIDKSAPTDPLMMNRLYYLIKAAKVAGATGQAPATNIQGLAAAARQAVESREGADGYLRAARLTLDWTERLAQEAASDPTMGWALSLAAQATLDIAPVETLAYPGVVINCFIGTPGEIQNIRSTVPVRDQMSTSIDDKFRFEIDRRPGETFEMELTVCNYYRHSISGTVSPRLPVGWVASPSQASFSVAAGQRQRLMYGVAIPQSVGGQKYSVGGKTQYNGQEVRELHASRITFNSVAMQTLTVTNGAGSGNYPPATQVTVSANPPASGQQFTGWTGDVSILANPAAATTTATIPSSNVSIKATYAGGATGGTEKIRYCPRSGFGWRMVGGVFEGSNGNKDTGPYTPLHTIATEPSGWKEVDASLGGFRYLRYRSPSGGFCNVAEIEFYRNGNKLSGPGFGTAGSYSGGSSDAYTAALDGNSSTFFDSNQGSNAYVGIGTGASLYALTVNNGSGDGTYLEGTTVTVSADAPPAGQQFSMWTEDTPILSNPLLSTTSALIPAMNVSITATYTTGGGGSGGTGTGLLGQYYNDPSNSPYPLTNPFTGAPVLTRTDAIVDFVWSGSSPYAAVTADNFSVKWTGQVEAPVSGTYTFTARGDDGVRLYLSGTKVADGWSDHGPTDYTYTTNLTAGTKYDIALHFYEHSGGAECKLQWSYPSQAKQAIPQGRLYPPTGSYTLTVNSGSGDGSYTAGALLNVSADAPPAGQQFAGWTGATSILANPSAASTTATMPASNATITATYSGTGGEAGTGLRGQYYNDGGVSYPLANPFTGTPVLTRTDATVDFVWGQGSPGAPVTINNFSAKWTGKVKPPVTGSYTFTVRGDDGVRLFISGTKVIDGWSDHGPTDFTYTTNLAAGTMYDIELHFYENGGGAECKLQWSYPGQAKQAIPQGQLFPPTGSYTLTVNSGSGDGSYAAGTQVNVSADAPPAGEQFAGWTGNTSILADPSAASTTATMLASNATITATFSGTGSQTATYEAEGGVLANGASVANDGGASGGKYAGSMGNTNASITWNNVIGVGGAAVLTIRYGTHITNVVKGLYVNGVRVASVSLPATGAFTIYSTQPVNVTLNSGANTVAIVNDSASTGAVNIDKVDVQ